MKRMLYRQHGRYSIELKFRYLIPRNRKKWRNRFKTKFYFFFPYSFNIDSASYPKEHYYEDQKLYLRFNTPRLSLQELEESKRSPFLRSGKLIQQSVDTGSRIDTGKYLYESKLCGSIYKSTLRDTFFKIRKQLKKEPPEQWQPEVELILNRICGLADSFHSFIEKTDEMAEEISYHTRLIDEFISLEMEKNMLWLHDLFCSVDNGAAFCLRIERILADEMVYRRDRGYATVSRKGQKAADLEEYAYRAKILKRYASEVLFFNVRRKAQGKRAEHILYAAAAGIAMFFATFVAFIGQTRFDRLSTSLFILLVVSYMLKDRLKDIFRDLFRKSIGSFFYDRATSLFDPRERCRLARIKERVSFMEFNKLPPEIRKIRNRGSFERFLSDTADENILVYEKNIRLNSGTIRRIHSRVRGIAEINILGVHRLLRYLGVQRRLVPIVDGGILSTVIPAKRIYHLNLIVWYQGDDTAFIDRLRLVVDGKGIKRIEKIESMNP